MEHIKVVLLGFGTVGKGVFETIESHQQILTEVLGKRVEIVGVLIKDEQKHRNIPRNVIVTTNIQKLLEIESDVVFEAIIGIEPANSYIKSFLEKGCHVISANKELLAHEGVNLLKYAEKFERFLTFEAAVAGGIPILRTIIQLLQVNGITSVEGILNGTSNYILSKMRREKISFKAALHRAQQLGYAEADPAKDIEGTDSFYKLMILCQLIYGRQSKWDNVRINGITSVSAEDIQIGEKFGLRLKLISSLIKEKIDIITEVRPVFIGEDHPLYNVEGVNNGVVVTTDLVGSLLLQGPGAGSKATASAMLEDLVYILQEGKPNSFKQKETIFEARSHSVEHFIWLCIHEERSTDGSDSINPKLYNLINKCNHHNVTHVKQERIKIETGYIIGNLLVGNNEDISKLFNDNELDTKRIYPISSIGFSLNIENHQYPLLQSTTI
jgi:homoserine dehydrogenase